MQHGKGLRRSTPARVAHRLGAALHLGLTGTPKGSEQLVPCQRLDQGQTSCCAEHSSVAAIWTAFMATGKPSPFVGSPLTLASCTYADRRSDATPPGQTLPELADTGAELQEVAEALARWGLAPMGPHIPGRGGLSDVPDDVDGHAFPEPDRASVELAGQDLVAGEYAISVDSNAPTTVALALDAGIPVWVGCFVDSAFENLWANGIAQPPNEADPNGGGHALYISGYRTNAAGQFEYLVQNSWGSSWADGGAVWASTAWLLACWNLFPMKVAS